MSGYRLNSQNERSLPDIGTSFFVSQSLQFSFIIGLAVWGNASRWNLEKIPPKKSYKIDPAWI